MDKSTINISEISGTFVALGVWGSGMIENRRFNLVEFYVKMGKMNRSL